MYTAIDALPADEIDATLTFLWAFVEGSPTGKALRRRIALDD
jgi:hypothetical protein